LPGDHKRAFDQPRPCCGDAAPFRAARPLVLRGWSLSGGAVGRREDGDDEQMFGAK